MAWSSALNKAIPPGCRCLEEEGFPGEIASLSLAMTSTGFGGHYCMTDIGFARDLSDAGSWGTQYSTTPLLHHSLGRGRNGGPTLPSRHWGCRDPP